MARHNVRDAIEIIRGQRQVTDEQIAEYMRDTNMDTAGAMLNMWVRIRMLRQLEQLNENMNELISRFDAQKPGPGRPRKG